MCFSVPCFHGNFGRTDGRPRTTCGSHHATASFFQRPQSIWTGGCLGLKSAFHSAPPPGKIEVHKALKSLHKDRTRTCTRMIFSRIRPYNSEHMSPMLARATGTIWLQNRNKKQRHFKRPKAAINNRRFPLAVSLEMVSWYCSSLKWRHCIVFSR